MTYDVCIVGAGPSGATCAWYLAKAGKTVLLLEKRKFPRDKICGDAVCLNAQNHMAKMGVLQITAADSTDVSDYGVFDTTTIENDITAVVNVSFAVN